MATFKKREDCPTSQRLVAYQAGDLEREEGRSIGGHLSSCEFCSAEVDFYERYPQTGDEPDDVAADVSMPKPLYDLAEALLNRNLASSSMESILNDLQPKAERKR